MKWLLLSIFFQFCLSVFSVAVMTSVDERKLDDILHRGNNKLTATMFSEVLKEKPDQSVVLSAFSVLTPLAQLALASVGESHDELLDIIGMPNDTITKAVFSRLHSSSQSINGITLKTASKIYVAIKIELNNNFSNLTRDIFGSEIANVDFTKSEETAQEINRWVKEQTNDRIIDLVDPTSLDANTKSILVNAIYFKGLWEVPFNNEYTRNLNFHVSKEKVIQVPTMFIKEQFRYMDSNELSAQVLELKYKGRKSALYILLPYEIDGIMQLKESIKYPSLLDYIIERMEETELEVYLPRLKIETTTDFKEVLQKMNVKKLFSEKNARLENLLKTVHSGLYINDMKQKAFFEVNEEGAEAAAANYVADLTVGGGPPIFKANHPFIFFLTQGNNILFAGTYFGIGNCDVMSV